MVKIREYQVKRKTDFASSLDASRKWRKITEDPWARMGPWIRCKGKEKRPTSVVVSVFIVSAGVPRADFARILCLEERLRTTPSDLHPEKVKGHTATASLGHEFRRLVTRNRADFKATNSQHSAGSSAMGSLARAIDTRGGRTPTQLAQALGQSAVAPECCGSRFEASGSARACS
ncbi:hypothetical protein C8F04DRAFT_1200079 [Mycena alexandri]|uniref:Uncharacterized protein n=1 Tax=Mycena alexandri TaxID=1745969 RepID=A0AAD6WMA0_9AGAR|nr:hypothetical protein C8F04DRAFT_1200079 [Mycena alexandri]